MFGYEEEIPWLLEEVKRLRRMIEDECCKFCECHKIADLERRVALVEDAVD